MEGNIAYPYLDKWRLSDPQLITQSATGTVFKVNSPKGASVLKVFSDLGVKDEGCGTEFLRACNGYGSVKLYEFDGKAQLIEFLSEPNLYLFSQSNKEEKATAIFVEVVRQINQVRVFDRERLTPLASLFEVFDRVTVSEKMKHLFVKALDLSRDLLATQSDEVLLHGDLHHENVMKTSEGLYVCFDPKGLYGDPSYELATTLKNPWGYPEISQNINAFEERAKTFSEELHLPLERIVGFAFVHLCMSIGWALESGHDYSHQLSLAQKVEHLI